MLILSLMLLILKMSLNSILSHPSHNDNDDNGNFWHAFLREVLSIIAESINHPPFKWCHWIVLRIRKQWFVKWLLIDGQFIFGTTNGESRWYQSFSSKIDDRHVILSEWAIGYALHTGWNTPVELPTINGVSSIFLPW